MTDPPLTVCNVFWGNRLAAQPHTPAAGSLPVKFPSLWPDKRTFLDMYRLCSETGDISADTVKLLLTSNTLSPLEALLSEKLLAWDQKFPGNMTLAHLVCALSPGAISQLLSCRPPDNGSWQAKDHKDRDPFSVCFSADSRKFIRKNIKGISSRNKGLQSKLPLTPEAKEHMIALAGAPEGLYDLSILLQTYIFDVNKESDDDGNTLIHLAVQGGLACLPNLFYLVNACSGDITLVTNNCNMTPACLAAKLGDEKITELLVCVFGASVNSTDSQAKWSLLHYAARYNHPHLIRVLLDRGADASQEDASKCEPIFLAQKHGHKECYSILNHHMRERVEGLAQKAAEGTLSINELTVADICLIDKDGFSLLMKAVLGNRPSIVRALLNIPDYPKDFRQMKVPELSSLEDSIGKLPTVPHHNEQSLKTAVALAAENGFTECLQIMLDSGAHPAIEDNERMLPLHHACSGGHKESVKAIISHPKGLTGLRLALKLSLSIGRTDIVSIIKNGMERRQREIVTPVLFEVAVTGSTALLYQLIEDGDDVNPTNEVSEWPIFIAAMHGHIDTIKMLYEHGGTVVRHHSLNLCTPLHQAATGGHEEVVRFLLGFCHSANSKEPKESCLDINEKNAMGASPLELATSMGHRRVVELLLDNGAVTTLPDSTGRLLSCPVYGGIQFLLENRRKEKVDRIVKALKEQKITLQDFKLLWTSPSDFNLRNSHGDTILMVASRHSKPDIVEFLIQSASYYTAEMKISWTPRSSTPENAYNSSMERGGRRRRKTMPREVNSSFEDSFSSDAGAYGYMRRRQTVDSVKRPQTSAKIYHKSRSKHGSRLQRSYDQYDFNLAEEETSTDDEYSEDEYIRLNRPISNSQYVSCPLGNDDLIPGPCTLSGIICLTNERDGCTALHRAVEGNQTKVIPKLLMADPRVVNVQDRNGRTALHLACELNLKNCVIALLNFRGIQINTTLRDVSNKMAEDLAIKQSLKKRVAKYREKQMKSNHPATRPLPPLPSDRHPSSQHLSPQRVYSSTPVMMPPQTPPTNNYYPRQLMMVPEDHPPSLHYPPQPLRDDDVAPSNRQYGGYQPPPRRTQSSMSFANGRPVRYNQPSGGSDVEDMGYNSVSPPAHYGSQPTLPVAAQPMNSPTDSLQRRMNQLRDIAVPYEDSEEH